MGAAGNAALSRDPKQAGRFQSSADAQENTNPVLLGRTMPSSEVSTAEQLHIKSKLFPSLFKKGYIYFVQGELTKHVKIGFTRNHPEQRIKALQIGSPDRLLLLGWCHGRRIAEGTLHSKFAPQRLFGEWFACSPDLLAFIQEVNGKAVIQ